VNGLLEQTGVVGQAIAVAFDPAGDLAVQFREPSTVVFLSFANGTAKQISLSLASRDDTGHDIFHTATSAGLACASCHPEGGDDSHVWTLDGNSRRTPSLRGTIAGTAPYHWPGDEPDLVQLTNDVYTGRMAGGQLNSDQMAALSAWIQTIPAPPPPSWIDAASAVRGSAVFERGDTLCATCHSGAKLTNNLTVYVGTGQPFQVPPLIGVGWRAPFLHDGCAKTIADRFGACATQGHGGTAQLGTQDLADLEMYLESL
jgi:cytochrome c peroxidase